MSQMDGQQVPRVSRGSAGWAIPAAAVTLRGQRLPGAPTQLPRIQFRPHEPTPQPIKHQSEARTDVLGLLLHGLTLHELAEGLGAGLAAHDGQEDQEAQAEEERAVAHDAHG